MLTSVVKMGGDMERLTRLDLWRRKRDYNPVRHTEFHKPRFNTEAREKRLLFCRLVCEALEQKENHQ